MDSCETVSILWPGSLQVAYQSVSNTTAVCPLNSGDCSGSRPVSLSGITANAPPPPASQLTEIYFGFACFNIRLVRPSRHRCQKLPSPDLYPRHSSIFGYYHTIAPGNNGQIRTSERRRCSSALSYLLGRSPENMPYDLRMSDSMSCDHGEQYVRYFDDLTKRPAIYAHAAKRMAQLSDLWILYLSSMKHLGITRSCNSEEPIVDEVPDSSKK